MQTARTASARLSPTLPSPPSVRRLYELCATGEHSVEELAVIAHEEHLTRGGPIHKSTVTRSFANRVYSGELNGEASATPRYLNPSSPAIFWLTAQAALDRRLGKRAKKTGHCFPFSGMLQCGSADSPW